MSGPGDLISHRKVVGGPSAVGGDHSADGGGLIGHQRGCGDSGDQPPIGRRRSVSLGIAGGAVGGEVLPMAVDLHSPPHCGNGAIESDPSEAGTHGRELGFDRHGALEELSDDDALPM